ncbi:hypothetical protein C0995_014649 [Termitomyces sp. Mi166|nr:hypothetical protein C0995_014649 [Termitomyces sp. Mi166\
MARSSSVAAWEVMEEPDSSEDDAGPPEDQEDELRSLSLKRKGLQQPISRASPKRQRTAGGAGQVDVSEVPSGSSSLSARHTRPNGTNKASAGSLSTKSNRLRAAEPGTSSRSSPSSAIAGTSGKESFGIVRSSQITVAPSFLRRSKSPQPTKLSKSAGQAKGKERPRTVNTGLPVSRSRSSSGPTKIPSKSQSKTIELTESSDNDVPSAKSAIQAQNSVSTGPPSAIRISGSRPPLKPKKGTHSPPPEGVEVITIDDSDEETCSISKPLPQPQLVPKAVFKETISPSQPSTLPSAMTYRPASSSSSSPKLIAAAKSSSSMKDTPALTLYNKWADDSDKMDVDSELDKLPSTFQSVPDGAPSANRSSVTTPMVAEYRRKSTPNVPMLDFTGRPPLPGRSRSSLTGQLKSSKSPTDDTRELRPPVLLTKSSSQVTPARRSSGLDMSGLKDVLTDAVSLAPRHTQPLRLESSLLPAPPSGRDLRPALHSSKTNAAMLRSPSDIKGKQKEHSVSSASSTKDRGSAVLSKSRPSNKSSECIDLTLDSDEDVVPPPPVPRPLPVPRPQSLAPAIKSAELLKEILTKFEPPPSPSLPKANFRSTELDTAPLRTASPPTAARNSTSIRPMPLPLPTPRPRPPSQEPKKASVPVSTPASRLPSQEPKKTFSPLSTSAVQGIQPTNPPLHHSQSPGSSRPSPIDDAGCSSDGIESGSGYISASASSPNEVPPARIPLPHRTARKSTRGRFIQGLPTFRRPASVSSQMPPIPTSAPTSEARSSMPPSSSQRLIESPLNLFDKPDNMRTCVPRTSEMMEVVTEDVLQSSLTTKRLEGHDGALANGPQATASSMPEPIVAGPFVESTARPATTFDDESELEYVDDPVPEPSRPDQPAEMDSTEMMDVEELLTASRQNSPPIPSSRGKNHEITPDPIDIIDAEGQQLRRSTRSSRSASGEPMDLFPDDGFTDSNSSPPTSPTPPEDFSVPAPVKTFGGYQSLNWRTYRQDPENMRPKCYFSKDLPHTLQDTINSFSEAGRRHLSLRGVMEAAIRENTAEDEPDAPLIEIINEVDDDPTPPWEFHYSNKMWFGEDVPLPDLTKLVHCNCVGRCDPKTKPCACAEKQRDWADGVFHSPDFLYDSKGHVRTTDYPIFECNDLCGCGDECRNRVVQHGRKCAIRIQKTQEKGWGVFAGAKKIYAGSFIGVYAGELLTDQAGEIRGITYNKFGRTYLFDLDFWHLRQGKEDWDIQYTVDAYHAGNFTRFLNHSCDPNCSLVSCYINDSDLQKPLLTVFAKRDIEPFEELCFSYSGESGDGSEENDGEGAPRSSPAGDKDAVYIKCACKASNCTGYMFK